MEMNYDACIGECGEIIKLICPHYKFIIVMQFLGDELSLRFIFIDVKKHTPLNLPLSNSSQLLDEQKYIKK